MSQPSTPQPAASHAADLPRPDPNAITLSRKPDLADARKRLEAFWSGSSLGDRPAVLLLALDPDYQQQPWTGPELSRREQDWSAEWQAYIAREGVRSWRHFAESVPRVGPLFGSNLTLLSTLIGGDYEYSGHSAWICPMPDLLDREELPNFDPQHALVRTLDAAMVAQHEAVGGEAYVQPPAFLDAVTTLSDLLRPDELALALIERPEDVRRWSERLTTIYLQAYEHFYRLALSLGYGLSGTWLGCTAWGRMEAVQCDFAVMLGCDHFQQFVMPDLERLTAGLDFSLYHLDGVCQRRFIDQLASLPDLNGIQWNPEPAEHDPTRWLETLRSIRQQGLSLYVRCRDLEQAEMLARELGPDGLCLALPNAETLAEAEAAIERVTQATARHRPGS